MKILAPVRPNVGLELEYTRKLEALIEAMHKSIMWWVLSGYNANTPNTVVMAEDDSTPSVQLERIIEALIAEYGVENAELALDKQGMKGSAYRYLLEPLHVQAIRRRRASQSSTPVGPDEN
ncbi:MAG: hypothetical protein AWT59_1364 [Candidatus Gallionella acididurans]|uniref:Uncharacterized protein n=1 Tax=Candidatus Gallionella acididurans TaxID=1796491 RepID=A0A139BU95_9PROT|nr:MAG: hypothetical protein AWT59_1364 [Candidatus Gallionella acididurans]